MERHQNWIFSRRTFFGLFFWVEKKFTLVKRKDVFLVLLFEMVRTIWRSRFEIRTRLLRGDIGPQKSDYLSAFFEKSSFDGAPISVLR